MMTHSKNKLLSLRNLHRQFDTATYQRGVSYQKEGRVIKITNAHHGEKELFCQGVVRGTSDYSVEITSGIYKGDLFFDSRCDCPVGYNCKHVAAMLVELFKQKNAVSSTETINLDAPLSYDWQNWFKEFALINEKKTKKATQIYFTLSFEEHYRSSYLSVSAYIAPILRTGGLGKGKLFNPNTEEKIAKLDKVFSDAFAALELYCQQEFYGNRIHYNMNLPFSDKVLKALIKTNALFWHNQTEQPLQLGDTIEGKFTWCLLTSGQQKLTITNLPEGTLLLPCTPLHYFNSKKHQIGLIKHDFPEKLGKLCIQSPLLSPQEAKVVHKAFKSIVHKPEHLPKLFSKAETKSAKPIPHLSVQICPHDEYIMMVLSFSYLGTKIYYQSKESYVLIPKEYTLWQINRDFKAEEAYLNVLKDNYDYQPLLTETFPHYYDETEQFAMHNAFEIGLIENLVAFKTFRNEVAPQLIQKGWEIVYADDPRLQTELEIDEWYSELNLLNNENGVDWFELELGVIVQGRKIDLLPHLLKAIQNSELSWDKENDFSLLAIPDTGIVPIPKKRVDIIMKTLSALFTHGKPLNTQKIKINKFKASLLAEIEKAFQASELRKFGDEKLFQLAEQLNHFTAIEKVQVPKMFKAELRDYQQTGLNWLSFLRQYGLGGILADDMGLGKTIQTLALLSVEKHHGRLTQPSIIFAPTSVIYNWANELEKFAPNLKMLLWHGDKRKNLQAQLPKNDIILSTYPLLVRDKEIFLSHQYYYIILDEAQTIKNAKAKMTQIIQQLQSTHRLCLTGTPMENHLGELWTQFNFLMPGLLGSQKFFTANYRTPIEKQQSESAKERLNHLIKPFLLRRTKQEVVQELPEKTEILRTIELSKQQRDLYETVRLAMNQKIQKAIDAKGIERSQIVILDALLKLRQICCHPQLLKMEVAQAIQHSAKLDCLLELVDELISEDRKILIFSQFTSMLTLIENELVDRQLHFVKLTGKSKDRSKIIKKFQTQDIPIFLISLKAGGVGLNLTAADTVIHFDPWWNPSVEAQATDRAHRIGQTQKVFVYKLVCENTVEEKILQMQNKKRALMEAVFSEGTHQGKVDAEDLQILLE